MSKELSEDLRWRVVYLYADSCSIIDIANTLYMSKSSLQKKAYERSEIIRAHYLSVIIESYIPNQLIFIDESAKDERSLSRFYGYSPQNIRACKKVVFVRGKRYTILPALTLDGFVAIDIFEGVCDKKRFIDFILDQVVPIMNSYPSSNSIIVMNNTRIHHDANLISILEGLGCRVIFLPSYSLDYNPIKTAFSTDEMVQFMIKEKKNNNDYYHILVEGGKRTFWENVVMKVNLKYKSRFIGNQVKEKFQGIIRDCRLMKMYIDRDSKGKKTRNGKLYYEQFEDFFWKKKESKYDIKHHENVERRREIVTLSKKRNLEEKDKDHI
ncbi:TPR domain-containing protein [Rhizophagus clarus]|uniref:TPR domain-containing protein n=1 Tax=Rhizophagus clarus TaxID=94130 RepID=A0A8H3QYB7_9GLOM|nr:TPR domain-containing protein [Rhizophagus clarus]